MAAFEVLTAAREEHELEPEDLERLGESAWWTGHHEGCVDARQRAYRTYLERDEPRAAARVAILLVENLRESGKGSVADGWLQRATRLLADQPEAAEHASLELALAFRTFGDGKLDEAIEHARRALDLGARFSDPDVQALSLCVNGWALILKGRLQEGMSLFEEATAAAVGGELGPHATGASYCMMISVCHDLSDYERAGEWTEAARRWCERQTISGFPGACRVRQAEVLRLRGAWTEAELEAKLATDELLDFDHDAAALGFYEIGEVRLRIGDLDGAEEAFRRSAGLTAWPPEPGSSRLLLLRGDAEAAAASIQRAMEDLWDPLDRARHLPVQVDIALAIKDVPAARAAADELNGIAERYGSDALQASAAHADGCVAIAEGRGGAAVRLLRRAVQTWHRQSLPYEAARSRAMLAEAYRAQRDAGGSRRELEAARDAFRKLGAILDAQLCDEGLLRPDAAVRPAVVTRTFMFTDIVGSTTLIEAIGDDAWTDLRRWHDAALRDCFARHAGEEHDHAGDGFFVAFADARSAITCAMEVQRRLDAHRRTNGFAPAVRIGLHAAEAAHLAGDYSGRGVHAAARIGALAGGGEIVASEETLDGLTGIQTSEPREVELKGIARPVRVRTVHWR